MCGRYYLAEPGEIFTRYGANKAESIDFAPSYNMAPGQQLPLVIADNHGRHVRLVKWGLVPSWAKDERVGYKMINARAETLAEKPSFKKSLQTKRAIVPASGFFEWDHKGSKKVPYLFKAQKSDFISMAGLWDVWESPDGEKVPTFTIITTQADQTVGKIHDRMPVILDKKGEALWLDPELHDPDLLENILREDQAHVLMSYQISDHVNKPVNNYPDIIKAVKV